MNESQFLSAEYLVLLDALDRGVLPGDEAVGTLIEMGLLERNARGVSMTLAARVKLAHLRAEAAAAGVTKYDVERTDANSQAN